MPQEITILDHPLIQHKLTQMRDKATPTPRFRRLLREVSLLMAAEVTRDLPTVMQTVETPLEAMHAPVLSGPSPVLVSILRAGNGLLDGMLEVLSDADVGFVGLYRDETTLEPVEYYRKLPGELEARPVIVVDPMLATGNSACAALDLLAQAGARDIRFACLLAAPEGVARLREAYPDVQITAGALDRELSDNGYILPGLGDAGDRMFGTK